MRLALEEAKKCGQCNEVPVGAVISRSGEVIASEHNRKEYLRDATAHAEILAIRAASTKLGSPYLEDCTLYVTLEPCVMCAGAIIQARVGKVVFAARDLKTGALGSLCDVTSLNLNHQPKIFHGLHEEEASALLRDFFRRRRRENKELGGRGSRKQKIIEMLESNKGDRDEEEF